VNTSFTSICSGRCAVVAQLVRAPDCGSGGRWFDPSQPYHFSSNFWDRPTAVAAEVSLICEWKLSTTRLAWIAGSRSQADGIVSFSDYIVYVDESGDHNLATINPQSPVFVLAFCIFEKEAYRTIAVPSIQSLKFEFWGHDCAILHSHEIRKARGDFNILLNPHTRAHFIDRVNDVMAALPMTVIAAVIDKPRHVRRYREPNNPYEIALAFCMERLQRWLAEQRQDDRLSHVIVERHGKTEDEALELEFRRIAAGRNLTGRMPNLDIRFMDKKHDSTGLQIADLVAHPIGRHVINPQQSNRAFDLIEPKLRRSNTGVVRGYGLKVFP
jgi:hypothetical protein